ncbi:MAG: hypothetical protein AAF449_10590, partial [Myxococcota bacterium]
TVACDLQPPATYNLSSQLTIRFGSGSYNWPAWAGSPDSTSVQNDFCNPLETELLAIQSDIQTCTSTPTDVWDMSFLSNPNWCNEHAIANTVCQPLPHRPLAGTCVCDSNQPMCSVTTIPDTDCGNQMTWKVRQQLAVCETYAPDRLGRFFRTDASQSDNISRSRNAPPPSSPPGILGPPSLNCRENVAVFLTDGAFGDTDGVRDEAAGAQWLYESADGRSNMFVFHISNVFQNEADTMQRRLTNDQILQAFEAGTEADMQESFSRVLSRIYKGVYSAASLTLDSLQRRAVLHSFTVPGYNPTGVSDDYIGMPSRISVHEVMPSGVVDPTPLYESDEASRVAASAPGCGVSYYPPGLMGDMAMRQMIGPGSQFRNGVSRDVTIPANSIDRDGDGAIDNHPALRFGRSFGFGHSRPLIVDAPQDVPTGGGPPADAFTHLGAARSRPRVIYYQSNGYVLGLHGGNYDASTGQFGTQRYTYQYDDGNGYAGSEVFRYRPSWIDNTNTRYQFGINDLVQQQVMTGQLTARELYIDGGYHTVLLGNHGKDGVGFFAIDVTDPCSAPSFAYEWTLPVGSYASNEPNVYQLQPAVPLRPVPPGGSGSVPVMVLTSGLDSTNSEIYMYDIEGQSLLVTRPLPSVPGESYPTSPVCVDARGEGTITHCYALRSDGFLARVSIVNGTFAPVVDDVTPRDASNNVVSIGGGRRFFVAPVAFYDQDGAVNILFGSGDYQNLTQTSGANYVYKVRDDTTRQVAGTPAQATRVAQVCAPDGVGNTDGVFPLGPGQRLISKPLVEGGVIAWATYESQTTGCVSGTGYVYAMDFETCQDAASGNPRPQEIAVGAGLPTTPTMHRQSQHLVVNTSAGPTAADVGHIAAATRGNGQLFPKRLYWRLNMNSQ